NVARLLTPAPLEEQHDLLLPEPLDVERAAGDEMLQMLDLLERAGELADAARNGPLLARRRRLAHHRAVQGTWAAGGKFVRLRRFRPLLRNHAQHLRDDVTGTLDHHRIADAHAEALDLVG